MRIHILFFSAIIVLNAALPGCKPQKIEADFVRIQNGRFLRNGKPYFFMGTNYWQGMNMGAQTVGGDPERLRRELDMLTEMGVSNLRILALSEGPENQPYRVLPAAQDSAGSFNDTLFNGLDLLLDEMGKRGMTAVVVLNNFWPWSGGMAQYVSWSTNTDIPYPPPHPNGSWDQYQKYTAQFYTLPDALHHSFEATGHLLDRKNSVNQKSYKEDPVIMAWELANEPRGMDHVPEMLYWIDSAAAYIKSKDKNHLVTVGAEGYTSAPEYSGTDFKKMHQSKHIDYTTAHIWIQNWGWYNPAQHDSTYATAVANMSTYLKRHAEESFQMGKPFVLEEFGIMKDGGAFDPAAATSHRDDYYSKVFTEVVLLAREGKASGVNFWAWSGEGRPREAGKLWQKGDVLTGDPPHEPQGWYSVYDRDISTQNVIREFAGKLSSLRK